MNARGRISALLLPALLLAAPPASAQTPAAAILAGVDSVDAVVALAWDSRIPRSDETTMRSRLETVFELELRQRGIVVAKEALNFLSLDLTVLNNEDGTVSYAYDIALYETGLPRRVIRDWVVSAFGSLDYKLYQSVPPSDSARASLEGRAKMWDAFWRAYTDTSNIGWVSTWYGKGGVAHVGRNKLNDSLERTTIEMAQQFVNAYIAVHPRR